MIGKNLIFDFNGADTSYLTHSLHPYPAKFPPQLPQTILKKYSNKGETVLDPFCGSGTTLVEARLQGINAIGIDVNGLSCLLSKVKATSLKENQISEINHFANLISNNCIELESGQLGVAFGVKSDTSTTWKPDAVDFIFRIVDRTKWAIGIFNQNLRALITTIEGNTSFPTVYKISDA